MAGKVLSEKLFCLSADAFEEFRVGGDVFDPKLTHDSPYVVRFEATSVGRVATELAQSHYS
jgi:hypothetical protein